MANLQPQFGGMTVDTFNGVNWLNIPTSTRANRAFMLSMCINVCTTLFTLFLYVLTSGRTMSAPPAASLRSTFRFASSPAKPCSWPGRRSSGGRATSVR